MRILLLAFCAAGCMQRLPPPLPPEIAAVVPAASCVDCPSEPYLAVSSIKLATSWQGRCASPGASPDAEPAPCNFIRYEVAIRCAGPDAAGTVHDIDCQRERTDGMAGRESAAIAMHMRGDGEIRLYPQSPTEAPDRSTLYEGPVVAHVELRDPATGHTFAYDTPTVWFGGTTMLGCVDDRPSAEHRLVPCAWSGVAAAHPMVAVVFNANDPAWEVYGEISLDDHVINGSGFAWVGERFVPLFSLADAFPAMRAGDGLIPATYKVRVQAFLMQQGRYVDHMVREVVAR